MADKMTDKNDGRILDEPVPPEFMTKGQRWFVAATFATCAALPLYAFSKLAQDDRPGTSVVATGLAGLGFGSLAISAFFAPIPPFSRRWEKKEDEIRNQYEQDVIEYELAIKDDPEIVERTKKYYANKRVGYYPPAVF